MEVFLVVLLVLFAAIAVLWWRRRGQDHDTDNLDPHNPRNDGGNRTHYGGGAG